MSASFATFDKSPFANANHSTSGGLRGNAPLTVGGGGLSGTSKQTHFNSGSEVSN